jgi:hypothetical protein
LQVALELTGGNGNPWTGSGAGDQTTDGSTDLFWAGKSLVDHTGVGFTEEEVRSSDEDGGQLRMGALL